MFTLAVAGIKPGQEVRVETAYIQLARSEGRLWSLRIPLTTSPRYVRADEAGSRHANAQPLAILRDPGHRFTLDLSTRSAAGITSTTHEVDVTPHEQGQRVRLKAGEVLPDRDCVLNWHPAATTDRPALQAFVQPDAVSGQLYFLALCTPPAVRNDRKAVSREVILLVDHSGSMEGAKWEAADWAVERFLSGLTEQDAFALGVFHNSTHWLVAQPRPATSTAVQEAVAQFRARRDTGGTELGVALEQALDRKRAGNCNARHVLIVTDAEVTDAGRLLRLADQEAGRSDRRRVSVLCIDAAPNATLATELAERGGGLSRFLTSDPNETDVTTALDEVLADWAAPSLVGLTLEVSRPRAETVGRTVSLRAPKAAASIDSGDPPAGRPVWIAGRVQLRDEPLTFGLRANGPETLAECRVEPRGEHVSGLKALFGAERIRRLEYLMQAAMSEDELSAELARLEYDQKPGVQQSSAKVYPENTLVNAETIVRELIVRESLDFGIASSETAIVATRTEAGQVVGETIIVSNALAAGWSERFLVGGAGRGGSATMMFACKSAAPMSRLRMACANSVVAADYMGDTTTDFDPVDAAVGELEASNGRELKVAIQAASIPTQTGPFCLTRLGMLHRTPAGQWTVVVCKGGCSGCGGNCRKCWRRSETAALRWRSGRPSPESG